MSRLPRSAIRWATVATAVVIVGLGVSIFVARSAGRTQLEDELTALRARQVPLTYAELDAVYRSAENDQTQAWLAATEILATLDDQSAARGLPLVGDSGDDDPFACLIDDPQLRKIGAWTAWDRGRALLDELSEAVEALHRAADLSGSAHYPTTFMTEGLRFDAFDQLNEASKLLCFEALVQAHQGAAEACLHAVETQFELADTLQTYPDRSGIALRLVMINRVCMLADCLISCQVLEADQLQTIQRHLRRTQFTDAAKALVRVWRIDGLLLADNDQRFSTVEYGEFGFFRRASPRDKALFLDWMRQLEQATEQPLAQAVPATDEILKQWNEIRRTSFSRLRYPLTGSMCPFEGLNPLESPAATCARSLCADTGIAAIRFQQQQGRAPESLDDLVPEYLPEVPIDPFSGVPLHWYPTNDGLIVYSVGVNRRDETGSRGDGDTRATYYGVSWQGDIVFQLRWSDPESAQ